MGGERLCVAVINRVLSHMTFTWICGKDADWPRAAGATQGIWRAKNIFSHRSSQLIMSCTVTVKNSDSNLVSGRAEFKASDEIMSPAVHLQKLPWKIKEKSAYQELMRHECCSASDLLLNCSADVNVN